MSVKLNRNQNEIVIQLRSAPGSGITIEILGRVELDLAYTENLELVWWNPPLLPPFIDIDPSPDWWFFGAFYRPVVPEGYYALGHYGESIYPISWRQPKPRGFMLVAKDLEPGALAKPQDYEMVWESAVGKLQGSFWQPVPEPGYVCLGMVAQRGYGKPDLDEIRCVREDLTVPVKKGGPPDVTQRTHRPGLVELNEKAV